MAEDIEHCPHVFTDFDPAESGYDEWTAKFGEARDACPVFWSEGHGGYWAAAGYDAVTRIARDWETFSSEKVWDPATGHHAGGNTVPSFPGPGFIPVESDPPRWKKYRFLLNPFFAPKAAQQHRAAAQAMATALLDRVIEKGEFDIVRDFSNPMPALVTLQILGIPFDRDDWERWAVPFHELAYSRDLPSFPQCLKDLEWIRSQLVLQVAENRKTPKAGLFSTLCNMEVKGELLCEQELVDLGMMILVGGVGTTTALFANTMVYLHQNREARRELIERPDMMTLAREEFVRFFSPVHGQARLVKQPVEVAGQHLRPGEQVLLAFSSANRDEAVFPDADKIVLDRVPNPHVGFGSGIHRCLGSFLARVFFDAMFTEVIERIPDYTVDLEAAHRYPCVASSNGWINVPARFTPGEKKGSGATL
jgi:cytochrome P450